MQPLTIDEALQRLTELIAPSAVHETITVASSLGRVVAEDITSPVHVPGFANSAMDGYAVRYADLSDKGTTELIIQGESLAGHPFNETLKPNHAVRIFTGAKVPRSADTIVIQENTSREDADSKSTPASLPKVVINQCPIEGAYVRPVGHDVAKGSTLLTAGTRLRAFEIASASTSGLTKIRVVKALKIGVFATGDELRTPGTPLTEGQIYESNRVAIISLLAGMPLEIEDLGVLPDNAGATQAALSEASGRFDALITSGGVSVGDADFVREAIAELGAIDFWRLNLRPGKPFAFGHLGNRASNSSARCLIFGLPGNPVSTIVTLLLLVKPALWHMAGAGTHRQSILRAPLHQTTEHSVGRHEYQRGRLVQTPEGVEVQTTSDQSSNRLQSFAAANCLFLMPGERARLEAGDMVEVLPFEGLT